MFRKVGSHSLRFVLASGPLPGPWHPRSSGPRCRACLHSSGGSGASVRWPADCVLSQRGYARTPAWGFHLTGCHLENPKFGIIRGSLGKGGLRSGTQGPDEANFVQLASVSAVPCDSLPTNTFLSRAESTVDSWVPKGLVQVRTKADALSRRWSPCLLILFFRETRSTTLTTHSGRQPWEP